MNFIFKKKTSPQTQTCNITFKNNLITFSTCWYILKSKFPINAYIDWINNLLSIANNFNLVIYTNKESFITIAHLIDSTNKKIKIIIKPIEDFYTYKYRDYWIKNHNSSNIELHKEIDWRLNMLWNEKIFFVNETITNKYFDSLYYGWCDIGYFRNRNNDLHSHYLHNWPNPVKLLNDTFKKNLIHYACVQNDIKIYNKLTNNIENHYNKYLLTNPNPNYTENCFAGGFFISRKDLLNVYAKLYDSKLQYYFSNKYFIKDDQTILLDIITMNPNLFYIHREDDKYFDNWFMFQRLLV